MDNLLLLCVLKIINKKRRLLTITPAVKIVCFCSLLFLCSSFNSLKHPFYVSVIDLKYNTEQKTVQISVRLFTNDLEDALTKLNTKTIDLINPKSAADSDSLLLNYIKQRLSITLNAKPQGLKYIGYEREEESIWAYLEIKQTNAPKTLVIDTKLLYDFLPQQINIVHTEINGVKKSGKVTNPDSKTEFVF